MSCWVTPEIAADLWHCSSQDVMQRIHEGSVPSKTEIGRLFVDVAPDSPQMQPAAARVAAEDFGDWRIGRDTAEQLRRPPLAA